MARKVILFGKTGEGKSTVANMLVSGTLDVPQFPMGDGMVGVTSACTSHSGRGFHVVDTVGVGEDPKSEVENAQELVYQYLKKRRGLYHHIIFVKRAERFDELDRLEWETFLKVFEGAENAFLLVFTRCQNPESWAADNKEELDRRYGTRFCRVCVDFPPVHSLETMEKIQVELRNSSLKRLEKSMLSRFQMNGNQPFSPSHCAFSEPQLRERAAELACFITRVATDVGHRGRHLLNKLLTIFR